VGYESHWTGEVRIEPPLTWSEIKNSRQSPGFEDLKLRTIEQVEDTATGQVRTVTADAVVPMTAQAFNGYSIEAELQAAVDAHPGHEFAGAIEARPLEPGGTPWRYVVQERRVIRQEPKLTWSGESATTAMLSLIDDLRDPDPCYFDHHGYCQAHGWTATEPRCPHARAAEILAAQSRDGNQ
jgi:hypothetical protein